MTALAQLRALRSRPLPSASPPQPLRPLPTHHRQTNVVDEVVGIGETPDGEDCVTCGRTYPGNVHIPPGNVQVPVIEAAARAFWLSMEELKKVRGASALRNARDTELVQQVLTEYGYSSDTKPSVACQELINEIWQSMITSIGPDWSTAPNGWICPGCTSIPQESEAIAGLGALGAELNGVERTGGEEDEVASLMEQELPED